MNLAAADTFRISYRSGLVVATVAILLVLLVASWPLGALPLLLSVGTFVVVVLLIPAVSVRDDGLKLYGVNQLRWGDVAEARSRSVLGLPYVVVHRHGGMRWWIPLYVGDRRGLLTALATKAPAGNSLQAFAAAASCEPARPATAAHPD